MEDSTLYLKLEKRQGTEIQEKLLFEVFVHEVYFNDLLGGKPASSWNF